jgi:hypothetical protein
MLSSFLPNNSYVCLCEYTEWYGVYPFVYLKVKSVNLQNAFKYLCKYVRVHNLVLLIIVHELRLQIKRWSAEWPMHYIHLYLLNVRIWKLSRISIDWPEMSFAYDNEVCLEIDKCAYGSVSGVGQMKIIYLLWVHLLWAEAFRLNDTACLTLSGYVIFIIAVNYAHVILKHPLVLIT